jgi:hypothetical protein
MEPLIAAFANLERRPSSQFFALLSLAIVLVAARRTCHLTARFVDVALVDRAMDGGVFLSVGGQEAGRLPPFVKKEVAQTREPYLEPVESTAFNPVAGIAWDPYEGEGVAELRSDSLFETPPPTSVNVQTISGVPEGSVVLSKHTAVVSADGGQELVFTAGHLHALSLGEQNRIVGFVVTVGHLYKHHVRLPVSSVAELRHDRIVLTQGLDEVTEAVDEVDIQPA